MNYEKLQKKIEELIKVIENESLSDGVDISAAFLSHTLISMVANDLMSSRELHSYFIELEKRINETLNKQGLMRKDTLKVRREKNA